MLSRRKASLARVQVSSRVWHRVPELCAKELNSLLHRSEWHIALFFLSSFVSLFQLFKHSLSFEKSSKN